MEDPKQLSIIWPDYFKYRADLRGFELTKIENILRYSEERYFDIVTQRKVAVGKHDKRLGLVSYEIRENAITPVTVHATTRQQINFRLKTRRFIHE